ncbi:hypothetical protein [Sulfitobacter noctilucae]|uniref:hypothetical protein n=1 Tax=Sulfitobacter noctilucae TaxID=1342302 RepID=UPI0012685BB8|nr:hypothetical protein [Sulfitobacter noctilucae]
MPELVKLPSQRVEQLRQLSSKLQMPISDCIGQFIAEQIEKGNLDPDVPGVQVSKSAKEVRFKTPDVDLRSSRIQFLEDAAASIRAITRPSKNNPLMPLPENFGVTRRGTSVKIRDTETGSETTLALSVALDVAAQLERASKS